MKPTLITKFRDLGRQGGHGADSIVAAAMLASDLARKDAITFADGATLYRAYREGYDEATRLAVQTLSDAQMKVQISLFRTFLKPAVLAQSGLHDRALGLRAGMPAPGLSVYNGLVQVNRRQVAAGTRALTDDEIRAALSGAPRRTLSETDRLAQILATMQACYKLYGSTILEPMIADLDNHLHPAMTPERAALLRRIFRHSPEALNTLNLPPA
jgi:hypothetical protein